MKNIAAAMKPQYSKLLIFEWILSAKDTPLYPALLDIRMMTLLNGMERTEAQWTQLLTQAGLEVVKSWKAGTDSESLLRLCRSSKVEGFTLQLAKTPSGSTFEVLK